METAMSMEKGLTSLVVRAGRVGLAYRWNMGLKEAAHTFGIRRGRRLLVAVGPLLFEWCR